MTDTTETTIGGLPAVSSLTGSEVFALDQGGATKKATISQIAGGISAPLIVVSASSVFPQSRLLTAGTGISFTDGGVGGAFTISATGGGNAPDSATYLTITPDGSLGQGRTIAVSTGLTAVDGGAGSSYTLSVTGNLLGFQSISGTGPIMRTGVNTFSVGPIDCSTMLSGNLPVSLFDGGSGAVNSSAWTGDAAWTDITTLIGRSSNATFPGVEGITVPYGTTLQRAGSPPAWQVRGNTTTNLLEFYDGSSWTSLSAASFTGVSWQKDGVFVGNRNNANFITGSDIVPTVTDNSGSSRVDLTMDLTTQAGVTPATYGSGSQVAQVTVNSKGVITAVTAVPITVGGMNDPGGNGIVVRTALNTTTSRQIDVGSILSVSNADGTAGNPTITTSMTTGRLLGRTTALTGVAEEISVAARLSLSALTLDLATTITGAGGIGSSSVVPVITYDDYGRLTTVTTAAITPAAIGALTNASTITAGGPTGSSSVVPVITYNATGQLTSVTTATITAASIGAAASNATLTLGSTTLTLGNTTSTVAGLTLTAPVLNNSVQQVTGGISAAGSTQGTATSITADINVVTTTAASTGVVLPTPTAGRSMTVINRGANALAVYPASGGTIDGLAANAAFTLPVNGSMTFSASTTTQWYSVVNTLPVASGGTGSTFFTVAGPTATRTYTFPDANTTVAGLGTTQTFTGVNSYSAATRGTVSALTSAATITPDMAVANNFSLTLATNATLANPTNQTAGQSGAIVITQDGTGSRTLAYGTNWKWAGGSAPVLSTAAGTVDVLTYYVESASRITATLLKGVA